MKCMGSNPAFGDFLTILIDTITVFSNLGLHLKNCKQSTVEIIRLHIGYQEINNTHIHKNIHF